MNESSLDLPADGHPNLARDILVAQFDLAWALADYHLGDLTTEECLRRPGRCGLTVRQAAGGWTADWPEHEGYDLGPPSVAWITWHMLFWWSMAHDHTFGPGRLTKTDVIWPGDAEVLRSRLRALRDLWRHELLRLNDVALAAADRVRWPFTGRPLGELLAWANVELSKSASELGYARFVLAAQSPPPE